MLLPHRAGSGPGRDLLQLGERAGQPGGDRPQVVDEVGAAEQREVEPPVVGPRRHVEPDPLQDRADAEQVDEPGVRDGHRLPRPAHVGDDDVERRVVQRRTAHAGVAAHGQRHRQRRGELHPVAQEVRAQRLLHQLGGTGRRRDGAQPCHRVLDVGGQGREQVGDPVAGQPGVEAGRVGPDRHAGQQGRGRALAALGEPPAQRTGDQREHHVVDGDAVRLADRADVVQGQRRGGEAACGGERAVQRGAGSVQHRTRHRHSRGVPQALHADDAARRREQQSGQVEELGQHVEEGQPQLGRPRRCRLEGTARPRSLDVADGVGHVREQRVRRAAVGERVVHLGHHRDPVPAPTQRRRRLGDVQLPQRYVASQRGAADPADEVLQPAHAAGLGDSVHEDVPRRVDRSVRDPERVVEGERRRQHAPPEGRDVLQPLEHHVVEVRRVEGSLIPGAGSTSAIFSVCMCMLGVSM